MNGMKYPWRCNGRGDKRLDALVAHGCSFVASSVTATRIYRQYSPRVTVSHNQLGLSLSKRIRHGLVAKINNKKRLQTCETLGHILVNYSRARRRPRPSPRLATPRHVWPGEVRRASTRMCFFISPLPHTLASA
jgi:hypothetical protein